MKPSIVLVILLLLPAVNWSQTAPQAGIPTFGSFEVGLTDSVNRRDLNTLMQFPIVAGQARGLGFNFALTYNSVLWEKNGVNWSFSPMTDYDNSPGWNLLEPAGFLTLQSTTTICHPSGASSHIYGYVYVEPNGTQHSVPGINYTVSCTGTVTGTTSGYASDASGYFVNAISYTGKVIGPDGTQYLNTLKDTNGNFVTLGSTVTDSAGHAILKITQTASQISYQYLDPTGAYQTITLALTSYNVKTNFGCTGIGEFTGTANLPSSITYPNGWVYSFTYEATPGNTGYVTGRLAKATLPNGGYVQYAFGGSNDGIDCLTGNVLNLTRTINDGTTSWVWQFTGVSGGTQTTVTAPQTPYDPAANQTIFTFNSSHQETGKETYQGSSTGGTLLQTVNTTWSGSAPSTKITILEDNSTQSELETSYDTKGNLLSLKEHDWGVGAPGGVLRTTSFTYLTGTAYTTANILNRVTEKSIADSSGVVQYVEDTAYDGTALSSCPTGIAQHDDTNYPCSFLGRGNPTAFTTYTNASAKSGAETKNRSYDIFGNLTKADLTCCQSKSWVFSASTTYAYPDSDTCGATGGPQLTTSYAYNPYIGSITSAKDANNQTTTYSYDVMRRETGATRPDGSQITFSFADSLHQVTESDPIQGAVVKKSVRYLDGLGRTTKASITDASNNSYLVVQKSFDGLGRPYQLSNPYLASPQYWTAVQYDALGRPVKRLLQDGQQQQYSYATTFVTTTDSSGKQSKFQFNGIRQIVATFEPNVTSGNTLTIQTSYTYSVLDARAMITEGSQARSYAYDGMGRMTGETTPEAGTTSYQYDGFDNKTTRTDARGVITTYSYDGLNRRTQTSYNVNTTGVPATPTVTYSYGTNPSLNNNGRLLSITDGLGSETYNYDILGRKTQTQRLFGTTSYTTGYAYNQNDSLTSITYPSGKVIQKNYDAIGRLAAVANGSTNYVSSIGYNGNFQITGFANANGVTANLSYSADRGQLAGMTYTGTAGTILGLVYSYSQTGGNNGQVTSISDSIDSGRTVSYTYDALGRLSTAGTLGSANYSQWGLSFTYDRYGNRTNQTVTAGTVPSNSVVVNPATNRITTSGYSYDADGDMTSDGSNSLTYDAENRVVSSSGSAGSGTYGYDGNGVRVQKTSSGATTFYIFDGLHETAEYASGSPPTSPAMEYIYFGDRAVAQVQGTAVSYHHRDSLSTRYLTDSSGNVLGQQGHLPFGETWYSTGTATNRKFTSYERDSESGNDNAMRRFAVTRLGRFLSGDPRRSPRPVDPQTLNRYAYVGNDPTNRIDPSGEVQLPCLGQALFGESGLGDLSGLGLEDATLELEGLPFCPLFPILIPPQPPEPVGNWVCKRNWVNPKFFGLCGYSCILENPPPGQVSVGGFIKGTAALGRDCGFAIKECPYKVFVHSTGDEGPEGGKIWHCEQNPTN
jgi:RHS repeat-associated protein